MPYTLWSRCAIGSPTDCWLWVGPIDKGGYGRIGVDYRNRSAHSVAYELVKGPVPVGFELDHICRNRSCINPAHLEPVTHQENMRRGFPGGKRRNKTHCVHGHEYTEQNTYHRPNGSKVCKTCILGAMKLKYQERKAPPKTFQTHCAHGHAYDDANTYRYANTRRCKACNRLAMAKYYRSKSKKSA